MKKTITKFRANFLNGGYTEAETLEKLQADLKLFNLDYEPEIIEVTEDIPDLRPRKYLCNDSFEDPSNILLDLLPLKSKKIYDYITLELAEIHHYKDYDIETDIFSNLAVREAYQTYYHDDSTTIKAQVVKIDWLQELFADDTESEIIGVSKTITNTEYFVV